MQSLLIYCIFLVFLKLAITNAIAATAGYDGLQNRGVTAVSMDAGRAAEIGPFVAVGQVAIGIVTR
jgi:UDP-N-acetylmuramyl pentapeptide phosphotransferase/UDP-N-acetylglucosamine-1-phosphate transferase